MAYQSCVMDASLMKRMKELEDENKGLKDVRGGMPQRRSRAGGTRKSQFDVL